MPDEAVDLDYLADHLWFVGSPETVAGRIRDLHEQTGGFGRQYEVLTERSKIKRRTMEQRRKEYLAQKAA